MSELNDNSPCPACGEHSLWRDSADVGIGVIFGPYGCSNCGWSEDSQYDQRGKVNSNSDQYGRVMPKGGNK